MKEGEKTVPADAGRREEALDPERSFIVQAPAGSGKTELLIQRFLCLLAGVDAPEEIAAITFTRKAAAEMRSRILEALERAKNPDPPESEHRFRTWKLARAAEARNRKKSWNLEDNPGRLCIQTIDAMCAAIAKQMPFMSGLGAPPEISPNPQQLYLRAARKTVAELETGSRWSSSIEALIRRLDNRLEAVEDMIAEMLSCRDQWLRHVAVLGDGGEQRKVLEKALRSVIEEELAEARKRIPAEEADDLLEAADFAASNLADSCSDSPVKELRGMRELPSAGAEDFDKWLGVCELLLTGEGRWRRRADKNLGFPAPSSIRNNPEYKNLCEKKKALLSSVISRLAEDDALAERLNSIRHLPEPYYRDDQWEIMQALFEMLRLAAARLQLEFQSAGSVDFAEVALRASSALGTPENPTDLALYMDYRIRHVLVDEFQDTSITQFEILRKLTMGWQPGDGRTFFAVGDPMQSIYGFREAQVGLFLKARNEGLGQIKLNPVNLSVNFRSRREIVDWINEKFPGVMPPENDEPTGAVAFSPSEPYAPRCAEPCVAVYPFIPPNPGREAEAVLEAVQRARAADPEGSIAVLARSRPHLESIIGLLKTSGISFTAVEVEQFKNRPVIQDLLSLARALSHPADRIAWLAVLRAPWCGLSLEDLYRLAGDAHDRAVIDLLEDEEKLGRLSAEGRKRAEHTRDILKPGLADRERRSLSRLVERSWLLLGGPACCFSESEFEDAGVFFHLLEEEAGAGVINDIEEFEASAAGLFARPDPCADQNLQVMTIHRAKGLEFDTVILPGLERTPPPERFRLLMWLERTGGRGNDLLLAPIPESGGSESRTYKYLRMVDKKKRSYEDSRLLYVAATRARKRLFIMAGAELDREKGFLRKPCTASLLYSLWPAVCTEFQEALAQAGAGQGQQEEEAGGNGGESKGFSCIRRLKEPWNMPEPPAGVEADTGGEVSLPAAEPHEPPFDWAGETVRLVGKVVHRWLRIVCEQGLENWTPAGLDSLVPVFRRELERNGTSRDRLDDAAEQVKAALSSALQDPTGRWILGSRESGACEYALTGIIEGKNVSIVIDRTFIDEKGERWIVDYKSGVHAGGSADDFLEREKERYREQMECYAEIMKGIEERRINLMLYYPQLKSFRCWPAGAG